MLGAEKPPSAKVPVVLDPFAAPAFLGVLSGALSAESVQKGRSLFADRLGDQIGSELCTIVDDGTLLDGPAAAPFDDEGVPSGRTELIENGGFRLPAQHVHGAARRRRRRPATRVAPATGARPGVGTSNFYVEAGTTDPEELLVARRGRRARPGGHGRALGRQPDQRDVLRRRDRPADPPRAGSRSRCGR